MQNTTIITRTPFRIPLGGGGTDLPAYYKKYGGFFISGAINKYMNIVVHRMFGGKGLRLAYSKTELVSDTSKVEHPKIREALNLMGIKEGLEIISFADVGFSTGLGSSGSFTVGLLRGLYTLSNQQVSPMEVAAQACHISMHILKEPSGKQDEYVASLGGIKGYTIRKDGKIEAEDIKIGIDEEIELEDNLMLFYTGITRNSNFILAEQQKNIESGEAIDMMHKIKNIGIKSKKALEKGNLREFGELMHEHWIIKKNLTSNMTNSYIDNAIESARDKGAIGEKILGAGGGGFLMIYAEDNQEAIKKAMAKKKMPEYKVRFEYEGSKIVYKI